MFVTATELKNNMGKYLEYAAKGDVIITKNGKRIAKLTSAMEDRMTTANSLIGILPADVTLEEALEARLKRHERVD